MNLVEMGNAHSRSEKQAGDRGRPPAAAVQVVSMAAGCDHTPCSYPLPDCSSCPGNSEMMVRLQFDKLRSMIDDREQCLLQEIRQGVTAAKTGVAVDDSASPSSTGEFVTVSLQSLAEAEETHMKEILKRIRHVRSDSR